MPRKKREFSFRNITQTAHIESNDEEIVNKIKLKSHTAFCSSFNLRVYSTVFHERIRTHRYYYLHISNQKYSQFYGGYIQLMQYMAAISI